jgi:murein L,D-transpeptidase YafK
MMAVFARWGKQQVCVRVLCSSQQLLVIFAENTLGPVATVRAGSNLLAMKHALFLAFTLVVIPSFGASQTQPPPARAELPGPQRAAQAVARTQPIIAPRLRALGARAGDPVFMRAFKQESVLELWIQPRGRGPYVRFAAWPICAASGTLGPKLAEGDRQVPEGVYAIPASAMNNASSYHLSMDTGYPNALDRGLGRTGSEIMVHGRCASIGCLAMTDPVINQVWTLVDAAHKSGQRAVPIHIFPFVMSRRALAAQTASPHHAFWSDLARVYAAFETSRTVPEVSSDRGRYRVVAR